MLGCDEIVQDHLEPGWRLSGLASLASTRERAEEEDSRGCPEQVSAFPA